MSRTTICLIHVLLAILIPTPSSAAIITVNETLNVNGVSPGFVGTRESLTSSVLVSAGDRIDHTVNFEDNKALRVENVEDGAEAVWTWLRGASQQVQFVIENAQLDFIGFNGSVGTSDTLSLATEGNGNDHLGPSFTDFLDPGEWIEFSGYRVTYDVASLKSITFPFDQVSVMYQDHQLQTRGATPVEASSTIPEPTTLAIWSLLGGIGLAVGHRRRRRKVA